MIFKINEIVLVDGQEATIRDIYVQSYHAPSSEEFQTHVSYRIHEKPWWGESVLEHRITKLKGELNFQNR